MTVKWCLHQLMFEKGVKNKELAIRTGLHLNTISKLKNMRQMPNRLEHKTLDKICEALGCRVEDLLVYVPDSKEEGDRNDPTS